MKLLCLGDSLTEGFEIPLKARWTELLQKELNAEVINAGIGGDSTAGMLARCGGLLKDHEPSHIIIFGGTNDLWFGLQDELILSNINAMSRQSRYHEVDVIIGILPLSMNFNEVNLIGENYSECIRSFRSVLINYCLNEEQKYIDFSTELKPEHYFADGVHIKENGQVGMKNSAVAVLAKK